MTSFFIDLYNWKRSRIRQLKANISGHNGKPVSTCSRLVTPSSLLKVEASSSCKRTQKAITIIFSSYFHKYFPKENLVIYQNIYALGKHTKLIRILEYTI